MLRVEAEIPTAQDRSQEPSKHTQIPGSLATGTDGVGKSKRTHTELGRSNVRLGPGKVSDPSELIDQRIRLGSSESTGNGVRNKHFDSPPLTWCGFQSACDVCRVLLIHISSVNTPKSKPLRACHVGEESLQGNPTSKLIRLRY